MEWCNWYKNRKGCHSKGSGQEWETGPQEPTEVQQWQVQDAEPWSGQTQLYVQTERRIPRKQSCEEGLTGSGGLKAWCKPMVCPCSPVSLLYPGLHQK